MSSGAVALPARWPLVGRRGELDQLIRSLGAEAGGAVLVGPPGVGKTRLAHEARLVAERRGWQCLQTLASPGAAAMPLGALASLLGSRSADGGRAGLVPGALQALADAAAGRRALLLVDDAHLLDEASAVVIQQAVATRLVTLVATLRVGEPAPASVTALWKDGLVERVEVGPLDEAASGELVRAALGGHVDGASLRRLWSATEGNALFLRELLLGGVESGALVDNGGVWRLRGSLAASARLHEIVLARIDETSPAEREVLELLAIGEPVGLSTLVDLVEGQAIETLERRGLLVVAQDGARRPVRLAHPLQGELLRERMPAIARLRITRLVADAVEAAGARRRDDVVRVAVWRLDAGGDAKPELMVAAAELAYAGRDIETAARLAGAAVQAGGDQEAGLLHSSLLAELGRHEEADAVLEELASTASTDAEHALLALRRSVHLLWALGVEGGDAAIDRAEAVVVDPSWREELHAQRVNLLALRGRAAEALAAGAGLLESPVDRVVVRASTGAAIARTLAGRHDEAARVAGRAWNRQNGLIDQRAFGSAGFHMVVRTLALIDGGRLEEATGIAPIAYDITIESGDAIGQGWFALALARAHEAQGDLATAQRWADESAAVFGDCGQRFLRRGALGTVTLIAAQRGDLAATTASVEALDASPVGPLAFLEPAVDRARAWHQAIAGDLPGARAALEAAAARWRALGAEGVVAMIVGDLVRLGGRDAARRLLTGPPDTGRLGDAVAAWALADDAAALEAAAHGFEELGWRLLAAEAAAQAAEAWRAAGSARQGGRAAAWSGELRDGTGAATPALAPAAEASPLTKREHEVAALAASGASNRAIADSLGLSDRTVENHLQRAYVKLGLTSRDELGAALGTAPRH